jgi:ligand-binding SRPBCC domain-containing protein
MTMEVSSIFEPKTRSIFIKSTKIPATNKDAFDYHAREGALERLVPPWSILRVTSQLGAYWLQMDGCTFRLFTRSAV